MSSRMAQVVTARLATLQELSTVYSYRELMQLSEAASIQAYNEWLAWQDVR